MNDENSDSGNFLNIDFVQSGYLKEGDDQSLSEKGFLDEGCSGFQNYSSASSKKEKGYYLDINIKLHISSSYKLVNYLF